MNLFKIKNNKVDEVALKPFKLEREIQDLVEKNTENFFQLEFIGSEITVGKYRIDSLCYDNENNSFVIIEYKKGQSYSVIDQGFTYLQLMVNNKSEFLLMLSQHYNKVLKLDDIDWSQSKIIFVSQSFNSYQKDSVNFKNLPFELWEIKRYSNNHIVFNKHVSTSNEKLESVTNIKNNNMISDVSKEIKVYDENHNTAKLSNDMTSVWEDLKERMAELDGVELVPKKMYINWTYDGKNICYFNFRKSSIRMDMNRGNIRVDGSKSKNFFTLDDPKKISKEQFWNWQSGVKGLVYNIQINKNTDLDYIMFLVKQKYNKLVNNA